RPPESANACRVFVHVHLLYLSCIARDHEKRKLVATNTGRFPSGAAWLSGAPLAESLFDRRRFRRAEQVRPCMNVGLLAENRGFGILLCPGNPLALDGFQPGEGPASQLALDSPARDVPARAGFPVEEWCRSSPGGRLDRERPRGRGTAARRRRLGPVGDRG